MGYRELPSHGLRWGLRWKKVKGLTSLKNWYVIRGYGE